MIDKSSAIDAVLTRFANLPEGHCLDMRTYKRNRSVLLVRLPGGRARVIENGYEQNDFEIDAGKLKKTLKTLLRREFPRSTKIRLYALGEFGEEHLGDRGLKKL
jgi:hypothetical protein